MQEHDESGGSIPPESDKDNVKTPAIASKKERQEVITIRGWREYLGESVLIVFSVVLTLGLTELFSKLHDQRQTHQVLHQLRDELINNRDAERDQYQYHQKIMRRIDSALHDSGYAEKFLKDGEVHLTFIIDSGVIRHDLNDVAWQVAKQDNAVGTLDLSTYSLLTDIYDNQQRIFKTEDEVGKVLLSWESRKPENMRTTLILVRDNFYAWAVQRAPLLLNHYDEAIARLRKYD